MSKLWDTLESIQRAVSPIWSHWGVHWGIHKDSLGQTTERLVLMESAFQFVDHFRLFPNVYLPFPRSHRRSGSSPFPFSFTIILCLVYKISPLYLKSFLGALPKDIKSLGMLHEKAIQECRAESRVPEERNTREFFFNGLSFTYKNEKHGCHQSYDLSQLWRAGLEANGSIGLLALEPAPFPPNLIA